MELTRGDSINIDMVGPKIVEFFPGCQGKLVIATDFWD